MSAHGNTEHTAALTSWLQEVVPQLVGVYTAAPSGKDRGLPDVVVELANEAIVMDDPDFPFSQLQQVWLTRYAFNCSFMVDVAANDLGEITVDAEEASTELLRSFARQIKPALMQDPTLGDRVVLASPRLVFDYTPPFVQYEDGTRGREMTMQIALAEPIDQED